MIAAEFIYDNIISGLTLNFPVYIGPTPGLNTSHFSVIDVNTVYNPAFLRDRYTIKVYGMFEKSKFQDGMSDIDKIIDGYIGHPNITDSNDDIWCLFTVARGPQYLGVDDNQLTMYTFELEVTVDSESGTYRDSIK